MAQITFNMQLLEEDKLRELDAFIESFEKPESNIISILHRAQTIFKYLPPELQYYVAQKIGMSTAKINGIVSFYSFFIEEPTGEYNVSVCMGTACFVRGADKVLDEFKKEFKLDGKKPMTDDGLFSLSDIRCVGACGLAPVVKVNEKIWGHIEAKDVMNIIEFYREEVKAKAEQA